MVKLSIVFCERLPGRVPRSERKTHQNLPPKLAKQKDPATIPCYSPGAQAWLQEKVGWCSLTGVGFFNYMAVCQNQ